MKKLCFILLLALFVLVGFSHADNSWDDIIFTVTWGSSITVDSSQIIMNYSSNDVTRRWSFYLSPDKKELCYLISSELVRCLSQWTFKAKNYKNKDLNSYMQILKTNISWFRNVSRLFDKTWNRVILQYHYLNKWESTNTKFNMNQFIINFSKFTVTQSNWWQMVSLFYADMLESIQWDYIITRLKDSNSSVTHLKWWWLYGYSWKWWIIDQGKMEVSYYPKIIKCSIVDDIWYFQNTDKKCDSNDDKITRFYSNRIVVSFMPTSACKMISENVNICLDFVDIKKEVPNAMCNFDKIERRWICIGWNDK